MTGIQRIFYASGLRKNIPNFHFKRIFIRSRIQLQPAYTFAYIIFGLVHRCVAGNKKHPHFMCGGIAHVILNTLLYPNYRYFAISWVEEN